MNAQVFVRLPGGVHTTAVYVQEGSLAWSRSGGASRGHVEVRFSNYFLVAAVDILVPRIVFSACAHQPELGITFEKCYRHTAVIKMLYVSLGRQKLLVWLRGYFLLLQTVFSIFPTSFSHVMCSLNWQMLLLTLQKLTRPTEDGYDKTMSKHHCHQRLMSGAFWVPNTLCYTSAGLESSPILVW